MSMEQASGETPRRRDSAATRTAILRAARETFTRLGYDGAGLREIARQAGVDARLIGRYFGSKERLFAEVVDEVYAKTLLMGPGLNRDAAVALLTGTEPDAREGLLLTLRSAGSEQAVDIMRAGIERNYQRRVTEGLSGPDAAGRAALLVSFCAGVLLMRTVLGSSALTADDVESLVPYLQGALDAAAVVPPRAES